MAEFKIVRDGKVVGCMQSRDKDSAKAFYAKTSKMLEDEFDVVLDEDQAATIEDDSFGETIN